MDESPIQRSLLTLLDVVRKLAHFNQKTITTNALQKVLKHPEIATGNNGISRRSREIVVETQ